MGSPGALVPFQDGLACAVGRQRLFENVLACPSGDPIDSQRSYGCSKTHGISPIRPRGQVDGKDFGELVRVCQ